MSWRDIYVVQRFEERRWFVLARVVALVAALFVVAAIFVHLVAPSSSTTTYTIDRARVEQVHRQRRYEAAGRSPSQHAGLRRRQRAGGDQRIEGHTVHQFQDLLNGHASTADAAAMAIGYAAIDCGVTP